MELQLYNLLIIYLIGCTGYLVFSILRLPMPPFLGAMSFVIAFTFAGLYVPEPPEYFFPALQILLGLYVGSKIDKKTLS